MIRKRIINDNGLGLSLLSGTLRTPQSSRLPRARSLSHNNCLCVSPLTHLQDSISQEFDASDISCDNWVHFDPLTGLFAPLIQSSGIDSSQSGDKMDFPTVFDPSTLVRKGLCPVTSIWNDGPFESHSLYFEQHGTGPEKILFIMGLNVTSFGWLQQVQHFGHSSKYSVLVFDNRGVGNSGAPRGPYTTTGMAADVVALLDYIGWTEERDLHIVGASLGGMIAQELSTMIPERIVSLTLCTTSAGGFFWNNLPPWKGVISLAKLFFTQDNIAKTAVSVDLLFLDEWLEAKAEDDPEGQTNRNVQKVSFLYRMAITKPQNPLAGLSQMAAGLTHWVTTTRLRQISASIPKVLIVTGDQDHLVDPSNSKWLKQHMPEAEFVQMPRTGHGLQIQEAKKFNALLEKAIEEGKQRVVKKWT